jgi:1,2-dihydroxy-3-keto-5-methylthiopentene dioxygenase
MATIIKKSGNITDTEDVKKYLAVNNVVYDHWIVPETAKTLTEKQTLSDEEKESLLLAVNDRFEFLQKEQGYKTRDLIVLHPEVPGLNDMLAKFDKVHYHTDEEVRYILDGSGYFGFIGKDEKFLVHVTASDFISVPRNTKHWFYLDDKMRIKAVRYFTDMSGWVPNYVEEKASLED